MLPQGINQSKMAQQSDSLSFRLIQARTGCPRTIWYFETSLLVTILIELTKPCYHRAKIKAKWPNCLTHGVSGWSKHIQGVPGQFDTFKPHFWLPFWWNWQNHVTTGRKSKQNCPTVLLVKFQVDLSTYRVSQNNWLLLNLIFGYHFDKIDKTMLPQGINQSKTAQLSDTLCLRLIQACTGCPWTIC